VSGHPPPTPGHARGSTPDAATAAVPARPARAPADGSSLAVAGTRAGEAAAALRLHARLLESMGEGVSVSDEAGIIVYTNPAEDRMFGYAPGELVGQHVTVQNAYPPDENARRVAAERGAWPR
jgi:PAS domain-containing protein